MKILVAAIFCLQFPQIFAQPRIHPYAGLHVSTDAEMYYVGPSLQLGADYVLKERSLLTSYVHYFHRYYNNSTSIYLEQGILKTVTIAVMLQGNFSKNPRRSMYGAAGLALQNYKDRFKSSWVNWDKKRTTVLPCLRFGFFVPIDKTKLAFEINASGPYSYKEDGDHIIEILTQLSFGTRLIL